MSHTMNGHPIWCPPARTKDYTFDPIETDEDSTVTLAQAAAIVRQAIKSGLIKPADKAETKLQKLGKRSIWATCASCRVEFTKERWSSETKCCGCRLPKITCKWCRVEFQPTQRKQVCCGVDCRVEIARAAAQARGAGHITVDCAWCGQPFKRRTQDTRKKNCTKECGFQTMAAKMRKPK